MNYSTQMDAARKGLFTPEMEAVSVKENIPIDRLTELMAQGKVIIPCNKSTHASPPTLWVRCSRRRST